MNAINYLIQKTIRNDKDKNIFKLIIAFLFIINKIIIFVFLTLIFHNNKNVSAIFLNRTEGQKSQR